MTTSHSIRTVFLMLLVIGLFMFVGQLIGGQTGLIIAFIFAMGMNGFSYWYSDKMVLKMYGAQEITEQNAPQLFGMVRELAQQAELPMPKVYVIPQDQPNAFATGRSPEHSAVAVTKGIMHVLSKEELKGVLAHEVAHIKHRDILTQTIVTTFVSAISMIANFAYFIPFGRSDDDDPNPLVALIALMLAPVAGALLQAAVSRSREYEADRVGAELSGNPLFLASALERIETAVRRMPMRVGETTARSTAHMFPVNPFSGRKAMSLFSTHPDTAERVDYLREMAKTGVYPGA